MKKLLIGLVGLVVVLVIAVVVVLKSMDFNQYKGMIAEQAKAATGRDLMISGDIEVGISLTPSLMVEGVSLSNAEWGSRQEMVTLRRVEAQVSLLPLLTGTVDVQRFILKDVDALLETDKKGNGNWTFTAAEPAKAEEASEGPAALPVIREVVLENVKLTYHDGMTGKTTTAVVQSLTAHADSADSPLAFALRLDFNGAPITVEGQIGSLAAAMAGDQPFPVNIAAEAFAAVATVNGTIARLHEAKGLDLTLQTKVASLTDSFAAAQAALPELKDIAPPPPTGIDLTVQAKDIDGGYALENLSLKAGKTDLNGSVTALLGDIPSITARLTSNLVDTSDFTGPASESAATAPAEKKTDGDKAQKVFSSDPLPLDGLKAVNADVTFKGQKVVADKMVIENIDLALILKNGKLTVTPLNADIFGGKVAGSVVLDGSSGKTANLNTDLKIAKLMTGTMASTLAGQDLIKGAPTDVTIKLTGAGGSVAALMGSLNGQLLVDVGQGTIDNALIDLAGGNLLTNLLPTLTGEKKDSKLACAVINAKITNGLAKLSKGIAVETSEQTIQGDGEINLKTEELDISINPQMKDAVGVGAGGVAKLVKLSGTLANPGVGIDEKGVAKTAGKAVLGVATGGLSIIGEKLLDASGVMDEEGADYPCLVALGKPIPKTEKKAEPAPAQTEPKKEEGLGGALKGLFGN
ncbi:AsmA family protein [Magnetospira thiophila]